MRRYKFKKDIKIPTTATADFFETVKEYIEAGKSFNGYPETISRITYIRMNKTVYMFSPEWLEEIEEEPISASDWVKKSYRLSKQNFTQIDIEQAFESGEANNELRHTPQQIFEEWQNERKHGFAATAHEAWLASEKNRGF